QPTTQESMFSYVRYSDGGPRRHEGPRSEVELIAGIGQRILGDRHSPIDWQRLANHGEIREAIGAIVPGWEKLGEMDRTKSEFHIPGRRLDTPKFPTMTERARLHVHELPSSRLEDGELRL